jgi:CheY-like chemotaxis protein
MNMDNTYHTVQKLQRVKTVEVIEYKGERKNRDLGCIDCLVLVDEDYHLLQEKFDYYSIKLTKINSLTEIKQLLEDEKSSKNFNSLIIESSKLSDPELIKFIKDNDNRFSLTVFKQIDDKDIIEIENLSYQLIETPLKEGQLLDVLENIYEKVRRNNMSQNNPMQPKKNAVLVVEDHPMNQQLAVVSLKKLGYENVHVAVNGKEAVDKVFTQKFDLILMDCQMPEMDGFEATKKIREHEQTNNLKRVPIIALTADIIKADRNKCTSYGMDDYLNKPLNILKLRDVMAKFIIAE